MTAVGASSPNNPMISRGIGRPAIVMSKYTRSVIVALVVLVDVEELDGRVGNSKVARAAVVNVRVARRDRG